MSEAVARVEALNFLTPREQMVLIRFPPRGFGLIGSLKSG
jgi:hypothetical protein